ncbi:MAG: hypothetical protein ABIJ12_04915, partial [bacterium]
MKNYIVFILILFNCFCFSQERFDSLKVKYDAYWDSIPDSLKGAYGYKHYLRQLSWMESRYDTNGTFTGYAEAVSNAMKPKILSDNNWTFTGPYEIPPGVEYKHQSSKGWISSCAINPSDHADIYVGSHHGGVWKTTDGGQNWAPLTDQNADIGGVPSLVVIWGGGVGGTDLIYALSSSDEDGLWSFSTGVFMSDNGGNSWTNINNGDLSTVFPSTFLHNLGRKIIVNPTNNQVLYLITNDNIYKTSDGGDNWVNIKTDSFWWWNPDPPSHPYGNQYGWYDIEIMISGGQEVIFVSGFKAIKSTDGGANWSDVSNNVIGASQCERCEIAIDNSNYPGIAYFFFKNGNQKITKYELSSNTYTSLADFGTNGIEGANRFKIEIEISPTRYLEQSGITEPFLYLGGLQVWDYNPYRTPNQKIKISDDCTQSNLNGPGCWVHDDIRCLKVLPENDVDRIYTGNDGGFSTALSNTNCTGTYLCWYNKSGGTNGLHCSEFYGVSTIDSDNELVIGGLQDCGVFVYNPASTDHWIHSSAGDGAKGLLINPTYHNIMFCTDFYNSWCGLRRSPDMGIHFINSPGQYTVEYTSPNSPLEFRPGNPEIMYLGQSKDGTPYHDLKRYTSSSTTWSYDIITPSGNNDGFNSIGTAESDPDILYVSNSKSYIWSGVNPADFEKCIWRTANSSAYTPTWVDISSNFEGLIDGFISDIEVNPYNENEIWVVLSISTSSPKIYKGLWDNGSSQMTWSDFSIGIPQGIPINEILFDKTNFILFAATDIGIYYCKANESVSNWIDYSTDLPLKWVNDLDINYNKRKIYAATFGRGMWENSLICNNEGSQTVISSNTTWDEKYLTGDLVVNNGAILTVSTRLGIADDLSITVQNGSSLILNGELSSICDGSGYWNGSLIIEGGGELVLGSGSVIKLRDVGNIDIQYVSGNPGTIEYYSGASVVLYDENTLLNIAGELNIQSNATFTYTGSGYIKFSNPTSEPHNITAGTNSGFVLNGTSAQTDKILEVAQTSIYIPENIETFTLNDGLVHMSNNYARIVPEWSGTDITVTDVLFTPQSANRTDHRGLVLCGQQNTVISGCKFEKGQYGIYAYLTWNGNSLEINSSEFEDNDYGVWENGVSIMLSECTFVDNTTGFYAQATSLDDNSITDCSFTGSDYPVRYVSCSGDLLMENSEVEGALTSAVEVNGSHTFTGICNEITDADNSPYAGLYATGNVIVYLDPAGDGESNYFANNYYHIRFNNANFIYLNNGLNMFYPNTNQYKFYGTLNKYACYIRYPNIFAYNNQWYSNPATSLSSSDYSVWKYGLCSEYYTIIGTSPTEFEYCLQG